MKANKDITHFQIVGEEGRRLVFTFSNSERNPSARILFVDEWSKGREVELDAEELMQLRAVLLTDSVVLRKQGARLELEDGGLCFSVHDTNRGEPYREGFDFNLEKDYDGYPIFAEISDCRDLARVIEAVLNVSPERAPAR
jgi:hypothetical protein